ncbi:MAG: type I methionyl aminopeptidase [Clostridia bacterium]|jgi:methionyl aminopeptidase|nr:type I methionyl aminopeptidase [Clostridia bacterium]
MICLKSERELSFMRQAGQLTAKVLKAMEEAVKPGITTGELDAIAEDLIVRNGGTPSFKGYNGFPASICTSVNNEVVHGIPGLRKLVAGDIISIDVGVEINGYHGDAAVTLPVGEPDEDILNLLTVTKEALMLAIQQAVVGNRLSDISHAVEKHVEEFGYSVVKDYVGHGIGRQLHEEPQVPNFGPPGRGPRLKAGMTLAIEPMVNMGTYRVRTLQDDWTVVTLDGKPSAHFEHTVAITDRGPEILTRL